MTWKITQAGTAKIITGPGELEIHLADFDPIKTTKASSGISTDSFDLRYAIATNVFLEVSFTNSSDKGMKAHLFINKVVFWKIPPEFAFELYAALMSPIA